MSTKAKKKKSDDKKQSEHIVHDIIVMVKETQEKADKTLEELSEQCLNKICRVNVKT